MQTPRARLQQAFTVLKNRTGLPFGLDHHAGGYRLQLRGRNISPRGQMALIALWIEAYTDGWEDGRHHGVQGEYRR